MKPFDSAQGRPGRPASAQEFWRTLEEKQGANLDELVGDEFASRLPDAFDAVERRSFLKLMGASLALAGMAGCTRQPTEQIVPYVRQPENVVPGRQSMIDVPSLQTQATALMFGWSSPLRRSMRDQSRLVNGVPSTR